GRRLRHVAVRHAVPKPASITRKWGSVSGSTPFGLQVTPFLQALRKDSDVETEVHDVAVLHDVVLAFQPPLARVLRALLALVLDEVLVGDDFGADEALLEIGVDDRGRLRRGGADVHG